MKPDRRSRLPYRIRYRTGEYLLRALVAGLGRLPASAGPCIAWITDRVSYLLLRGYRRRMYDTLERTMSEELPTHAERRTVVRSAWRNFAHGFVESFATLYMTKDEVCSRVEIRGEEHLRAALARKKGVIALSAHFGSFTMIGPRLVAAGHDFSVVIKLPRERRFAALQNAYFARAGVNVIPARPSRAAAVQMITALRRNGIVLLIPDEFKTRGVEVSFLGRRAPAPKGPVTIAQRTGASVVPIFMVRDESDRLTLQVEPEVRFVQTEDREADLRANAQLFAGEIERMVRRHPDHWSWMGFPKPRKGEASQATS
ncbi:MAG: lysophospholipid acyltransferase family protein [Deltaproteobacteria bacterium]|nr:lysophospholipid acyltransferase family protein [Deltaproteobacteria bacterium]